MGPLPVRGKTRRAIMLGGARFFDSHDRLCLKGRGLPVAEVVEQDSDSDAECRDLGIGRVQLPEEIEPAVSLAI